MDLTYGDIIQSHEELLEQEYENVKKLFKNDEEICVISCDDIENFTEDFKKVIEKYFI